MRHYASRPFTEENMHEGLSRDCTICPQPTAPQRRVDGTAEIMGRVTGAVSSTCTEERVRYDADGTRYVEVLAEGQWIRAYR